MTHSLWTLPKNLWPPNNKTNNLSSSSFTTCNKETQAQLSRALCRFQSTRCNLCSVLNSRGMCWVVRARRPRGKPGPKKPVETIFHTKSVSIPRKFIEVSLSNLWLTPRQPTKMWCSSKSSKIRLWMEHLTSISNKPIKIRCSDLRNISTNSMF